ncbi:hypothetical protein [Lacipirellula parvula]|uniref:Type II/III secretion system secretin-like domain-containing protein n=1 Tax=Lacipirellula parvula TaxID=2650471 RepID=A0A5K7X7M3_9BACT|nr:hypothetical protein [Lacipirellula parvula]BBO30731.1 hypothetical protein PLANPX_0343 [Lacipirellula parvula]
MVAKVFLAAAAILICCGTTLQGECPGGKCDKSGECATASNAETCSVETCSCEECSGEKCTACKCQKSTSDDLKVAVVKDEECCEKKKCSAEKCTAGTCQDAKCSAEKCSACKCDKSTASDELKVALVKDEECCEKKKCSTCSTKKCSGSACKDSACSKTACIAGSCNLSQCTAGSCGDGACSLTAGVSSMCETLKCAIVDAAKQEFTATCSGGTCSGGTCSKSKCECGGNICSTTACSGKSCGSKCSTVAAAEPCDTWFCFEGNCSAGECSAACSTEVCDGLKYAVEACLTLNGGEFTITTSKTWPGTPVEVAVAAEECTKVSACSKSCGSECSGKCAGECSKECVVECSKSTCGTLACSTEKCTVAKCDAAQCSTDVCGAEQSELDAKLADLAKLQREVAELRRTTGTPEQLIVNVKLVEVDLTKCRKLGFSFDSASPHMVADLNETIEKSPDFLTALQKNHLANVVANPTLVVLSGRPAQFHAGGQFPVTSGDGRTEYKDFGTKVDVLATTVGGGKVRMEIRPEFSEVNGECGPAPCPALSARRWDSSLIAELGKPFVLSSASERRVQAHVETDVTQNPPQQRVRQEVSEVQYFAVVTVEASEGMEPAVSEIHQAGFESQAGREQVQAAYEKALLAEVAEEEYCVRVYPVADLQVWRVRPDGVEFDASLLTTLIKVMAPENSWRTEADGVTVDESARGEIEAFERNGSLVICQTEESHERIADFLQHMRVENLKKTEAREQSEAAVVPASGVEPVSIETKTEAKCSQGACKGSKCPSGQCSKSSADSVIDVAAAPGECTGNCPEWGDCPCIGGTCTK